ncbi:MAG: hypothetical protein PHE15_05665 [Dehalococcoidales bacterium]|nr:hypothetical protein [Dehalococcoidales bacterium]
MSKTVLFVCVHNSGRSQMAEAFFNLMAKGKATARSAVTKTFRQLKPGCSRSNERNWHIHQWK